MVRDISEFDEWQQYCVRKTRETHLWLALHSTVVLIYLDNQQSVIWGSNPHDGEAASMPDLVV